MVSAYIKSNNLAGYFKSYAVVSKLALSMGIEKFDKLITDFKRLNYNFITMSESCDKLIGNAKKDDVIIVAEIKQLANCPYEFVDTIVHLNHVGARLITPLFDSSDYKTEEDLRRLSAVAFIGEDEKKFDEVVYKKFSYFDIRNFIELVLKDKGRYDLSEFESELKSVEYPENIFEIATEYMCGESLSYLMRKFDLKNMCVPTLKRLIDEFISAEFSGLVPGTAEYKQAIRDVIS